MQGFSVAVCTHPWMRAICMFEHCRFKMIKSIFCYVGIRPFRQLTAHETLRLINKFFLTNAEIDNDDVKDQLKSTTTCAAFGAGVNLPLGFTGGLRYVIGLTDLSDNDTVEFKDGTFQIYIGWTIFGDK